MGAHSVAVDAIYTNLAKGRLEAGTYSAQAWANELHASLAGGTQQWRKVALRQMSGILVLVFARWVVHHDSTW